MPSFGEDFITDDIREIEILESYLEGRTAYELASEFGRCEATIRQIIRKNGFAGMAKGARLRPQDQPERKERDEKIRSLYRSGMVIEAISDMLRFSPSTVRLVVRAAGILRPRGRQASRPDHYVKHGPGLFGSAVPAPRPTHAEIIAALREEDRADAAAAAAAPPTEAGPKKVMARYLILDLIYRSRGWKVVTAQDLERMGLDPTATPAEHDARVARLTSLEMEWKWEEIKPGDPVPAPAPAPVAPPPPAPAPAPAPPYTPRPVPPGYDITPMPCPWAPDRAMAFYTPPGCTGQGDAIPLGVFLNRAEADAGIEADRVARGGPSVGLD